LTSVVLFCAEAPYTDRFMHYGLPSRNYRWQYCTTNWM